LSQTYPHWEVLVVDDHSTDNTQALMRTWVDRDARIQFWQRRHDSAGAAVCRNEGMAAARGEYLIFLDSDDCLAPTCLEQRLEVMQTHPELDFAVFSCQLFRITPGDTPLLWNVDTPQLDLDRFLVFDPPWQTASVCWRVNTLDKLGGWNEHLPSLQDWDLHLRALLQGQQYQRFAKIDSYWRLASRMKALQSEKGQVVGFNSHRPTHLKSHERLFAETLQQVQQANLLTPERKRLFAGLAFWLSVQWACQNNFQKSQQVWIDCWQRQLVSEREFNKGWGYLQICRVPGLRRVFKKLTGRYWLNGLLPGYSQTFRRVPIQASSKAKSSG
jgi:glycosyltransferase involved in cell wall biosynthesis